MSKLALLIGINYIQYPELTLHGCIDDIELVSQKLQLQLGYKAENIVMLHDDRGEPPTKSIILGKLCELAAKSGSAIEIWIHYSGHGSRFHNASLYEEEDVLVPIDYRTQGFICGAELHELLIRMKCTVLVYIDACHSGTIAKLPYTYCYNPETKDIVPMQPLFSALNPANSPNAPLFLMSGCTDDQQSADAYSEEQREPLGAFTNALLQSIDDAVTIQDLYKKTISYLVAHGFAQTPLLSCSQKDANYWFHK